MPFSDKDKERLNTLCEYLYSTEIGKLTQEVVFGENKKTSKEEKSTIITDRAKKYFDKAIAVGYMAETETGYKWLFGGNKGQVRLGYFCYKVFTQPRPINELERLFGVKKLSASITNAECNAKRNDVIQWKNEMNNKIFND